MAFVGFRERMFLLVCVALAYRAEIDNEHIHAAACGSKTLA